MLCDRSYTWLISNPNYLTDQTHTWPSPPIFFEMLVKEKICNLRQLNGANYMSYSFQKTYQIIIFRRNVSFTEPLQLQGHWWHYETDTFYESNLVWIGEEVLGVLCKSLGGVCRWDTETLTLSTWRWLPWFTRNSILEWLRNVKQARRTMNLLLYFESIIEFRVLEFFIFLHYSQIIK